MASNPGRHGLQNPGFQSDGDMDAENIDSNRTGDSLPKHFEVKDTLERVERGKKRRKKKARGSGHADSEGGRQSRGSLARVKNTCDTCTTYALGLFVRLMLIGGNVLAAWRTVIETDDTVQWLWVVVCTVLMGVEYSIIIYRNKGLEWTWWGPCFLVYLGSTLPLVWKMQLKQRENHMDQVNRLSGTTYSNATGPQPLINNSSGTGSTSTTPSTIQFNDISLLSIFEISNDTWVIVVNESLVYLVIFSRWLLPRGEISREFLADMLLEFLAIASDIMELLALFDERLVRENLMLNYWILIAWSISFVQFIPVLMHKRSYRHVGNRNSKCLQGACGNNFPEVIGTLMSILVQDGSFLVLRLYIMIKLNFITYSLTFFVMKNMLSLLILFYRLAILVHNLPCCCGRRYQLNNSLRRTKTISYE